MTRVRFNSSCNYGFVPCLGFALLVAEISHGPELFIVWLRLKI